MGDGNGWPGKDLQEENILTTTDKTHLKHKEDFAPHEP